MSTGRDAAALPPTSEETRDPSGSSAFDRVTKRWGELRFMDEPRAALLRDLIVEEGATDLLEIGFWKGKSTAYFAAILEDLGRGRVVTIDREAVRNKQPNVNVVLADLGLRHRATPVFADRSHTWELCKMLEDGNGPRFDLCYFDGGHTWDVTGFGILLVDMLLRPGGMLIVDDLNWTIEKSLERNPKDAPHYKGFSADERAARTVELAWRHIVPYLGYVDVRVEPRFNWGIARKPRG